jgi:hypothetical protein
MALLGELVSLANSLMKNDILSWDRSIKVAEMRLRVRVKIPRRKIIRESLLGWARLAGLNFFENPATNVDGVELIMVVKA